MAVTDDSTPRGLTYAVMGSISFSLMAVFVYAGQIRSPGTSSLVSSFIRVFVNWVVIAIPFFLMGRARDLIGDLRPSLFLRGFFGALALCTYFAAIQGIGIGESAFLKSSAAIFVAFLGPLILGEKTTWVGWAAIVGSMCGLSLLLEPRLEDLASSSRLLGLASGVFGALAMLMVARAGRSNLPETIIFYFCTVATVLHLLIFPFIDLVWPTGFVVWSFLILSGLFAAAGQFFLTRAYQLAPAHLNAAVDYLSPVLAMFFGVMLFGKSPDGKAWLGTAIVLGCGVCLPFIRLRSEKELSTPPYSQH